MAVSKDDGLSNVAKEAMPARFAGIAAISPDPKSPCGEDFKVAASAQVAGGYALALGFAPPGEACDAYRFGLIDLELTTHPSAEIAGLRARLTQQFGLPTVSPAGKRETAHWQITPGRAVELQYDPKAPGVKAGVTIANVPAELWPQAQRPKQKI